MRKLIDLTGKTFGNWSVIERAENDPNGKIHYTCRCKCGKLSRIPATNLIKGHSKSCKSCAQKDIAMTRVKDLTGKQFGGWTVTSYSHQGLGGTYWNCTCRCGTVRAIAHKYLILDRSCLKCSNATRVIDMAGKQIGSWSVIKLDDEKNSNNTTSRGAYWICICKCGFQKSLNGAALRNNRTSKCLSCTGKGRERVDHQSMIGRVFYKWTVIGLVKKVHSNGNRQVFYNCQCRCGTIASIPPMALIDLRSSQCKSCSNKQR